MTEIAEGISVSVVKEDPEKYLKVKILEVDFIESFKTSNAKKKVVAPHWPSGKYRFNYSEKPAVFAIEKATKAEITVEVDSKGVSGKGILSGSIKGYEFGGDIDLSAGKKSVSVTLKEPPENLQWIKGSVLWSVEGGGMVAPAGATFVELFFVFSDPGKLPFFSDGVWADALRYLFEKSAVKHEENKFNAIIKVTRLCFNISYHRYEIKRGAPKFGGFSGKFKLTKYIKPKDYPVNCYDQTYAVVVFSGALGLPVDGLYMDPYGFLGTTQLVGWGTCNNPFPSGKYESEMKRLKSSVVGLAKIALSRPKPEDYLLVTDNDPDRAAFGNHMFCEYKNKIFDACAGPYIGNGDRKQYVSDNIDSKTSLNALYGGFPGGAYNIKDYVSVGAKVLEVV